MNIRRLPLPLLIISALAACGGSGGDSSADQSLSGTTIAYANQCAPGNPLAQDDQGFLHSGYRAGSVATERAFVRSYMYDNYLWYREMPQVDPAWQGFATGNHAVDMSRWFMAHLTPAKMANGANKDRFSFAMPTADWNASSQAGVVRGYGAEFAVLNDEQGRSRRVVVAYVLDGTPAARLGLARGDQVVALQARGGQIIDLLSNTVTDAQLAEASRLLFNATDGQVISVVVRRAGAVQPAIQLQAADYQANPVHISTVLTADNGDKVAYLMFNRFILPLESALINAVTRLKADGVTDAVIDLRYNGGGYLYQSSQLAWMLAAPVLTEGKVFEQLRYNDKRQADTGSAGSRLHFQSVSSGSAGSGTARGRALPNLGLRRVYVLTGADTCSASESLINGLRGVDVEVIQIGNTTCGKPYGFTARDNCGMSYFPIEFEGVNAKGVSDFESGFVPSCRVEDDFSHALGDSAEGLLAAALHHRRTGQCPTPAVAGKSLAEGGATLPAGPLLRLGPQFTNKFLMP